MNGLFDPVTLVFLGLAVFVIFKLRSVLGQKTGNEPPPFARREAPPAEPASNVHHLPSSSAQPQPAPPAPDAAARWAGIAEPGSALWASLDEVSAADPGFNPAQFSSGAKAAYEMIVLAFARGERRTLKDLLTPEVYDSFSGAISEREKNGHAVETSFVSIDRASLSNVIFRRPVAQMSMRFQSKIITATRDAAGKIVDGAPDKVTDVTDIWTFSRDVSSSDPNWRLMATEGSA